jgi:uncharacterized membrane protein YozB (DUF420 family)
VRQDMPASVFDDRRTSLSAWQDRIRNPSLTVLLVLELFLLFLAVPLAATGLPIAAPVSQSLVLAVLVLVVMLSHRGGAIIIIVLGLAAICQAPHSAGNRHRLRQTCSTAVVSCSLSQP